MNTKTLVWGGIVALAVGWGISLLSISFPLNAKEINILYQAHLVVYIIGLVMAIWGAVKANKDKNVLLLIFGINSAIIIFFMLLIS